MSFVELLSNNSIIYDLNSNQRDDALRETLMRLQDIGCLQADHFEEVLTKLIEREELGSTGVGNGIAVPHTKFQAFSKPILCIARSSKGISFGALDGEPVYLFFMLLYPDKNATDHLKALTFISTALRDEFFCKFLKNANNEEEMLDTIHEMDEKIKV